MIKKILTGLAIFSIALAVFVIANFPAHFATRFMPSNLPVKLSGVEGTIWRGSVNEFRVNNRSLGKLSWRLKALPLFLGKASAAFEIHREGLNVEGEGTASYTHVVKLRDTKIDAEVVLLPIPTEKLLAEPSGFVNGFITQVTVKDEWIDEMTANFDWNPASLLSPIPMDLGDISLNLTGENGNLEGEVSSKGALATEGGFQISPEGRLTADILLTPTDNTPAELLDILPMFGKPSSDGSVRLQQTLQLPGIR